MSNSQNFEYDVSAIVLVYNGEKFLKECIDSLVNQTLNSLEIILVDDASTDDSLYICREYEKNNDNIKIIQKEKNEGLASSANLGIKYAKGEYVILVDNDDIVPCNAYEKLYNKAKKTDSEVVVGKPNFLKGKYQFEMTKYLSSVWSLEQTVNPKDFPEIFHETFYWNKLIKRSFLIDNNIQLPVDVKVYADRKFSHTVMTYAKKISIIPDCVYLWRIRKNVLDESLSMRRKEIWNYIDRINSFKQNLDHFTNFYKDYFKILMRRVVLPVGGIVNNNEFEEVYFNMGRKLLIDEFKKMDNPFDNDLNCYDNLLIYLTINNYRKEIKELFESNYKYQREIYNENGKSYWNLHLFRNPNVNIPDFLFEINFMDNQFLTIDKLSINESFIHFKNIRLPKYLKINSGKILFKGKTGVDEVLEDNILFFDLNIINDKDNIYDLKINVDNLAEFEKYDVYFMSDYNGKINQFRISSASIKDYENTCEYINCVFSHKNLLSIFIQKLNNIFNFELDDNQLIININKGIKIKKTLNIFIENIRTKQKTKLDFNEKYNKYYLEWKFFIDEKSEYKFFAIIFDEYGYLNKKIRINSNHVFYYDDNTISYEKMNLKFVETKYSNLIIVSD